MTTHRPAGVIGPFAAALAAGALWAAHAGAEGPEAGKPTRLKHVASVERLDLDAINSVDLSADGKFVYCTAWQAMANVVFARDPKTGTLSHTQTISNADYLDGTTALHLSPDGRRATAASFRSQTVVLYDRDPETGRIETVDIAHEGTDGVSGLAWAIESVFSTDGKFVYAVDDRGSPGGSDGSVTVFRVDGTKLRFVESFGGRDGCFAGARGIAVHPDGRTLLVAANRVGNLVVLARDKESGKLTVRQVVKDEEEGVHGLAGVTRVICTPDGRFAYTSSGRFSGDSAVGVYRFDTGGKLGVVQELAGEGGEVKDWVGGNHLTVSPDGLNLYAAATRSGSLACFQRDPKTGRLTYVETLKDDDKHGELGGAAGVAVSPDSRFVYVAAETDGAVTVLKREPVPSP